MGYRSDVYIKCRKKMYEEIRDWFMENGKNGGVCFPKIISHPFEEEDKRYEEYTLVWEWIKWYRDAYNEVSFVERLMDKADEYDMEENPEYGYSFVRIGEDNDDIEQRTNDYDVELSLVRTVEVDFGKETRWERNPNSASAEQ